MTDRATTAPGLPALVRPMQASAVSGDPPRGADWVVEVAWTGHRCIAYVQPGRRVRLLSGADNSMSAAYPELAEPLLRRSPPGGLVLDGTLVARGEEHAVRPRLLKRRSARHRPSDATIRSIPVDFQVADLLWLDGRSTTELPYAERRALLDGLGFTTPPVWTTAPLPATELDTMLAIAEQKGAEGLHARHLRGRYHPGGRSRFWIRVPVTRTRQVLVGGWTPADRHRPESVGSLLLGAPVDGELHYVGRVGVSVEQRRQLAARLRARTPPGPPFAGTVPPDAARHAVWAEPELVGLAEFTGWIGGARMRRPLWRGLVDPAAVRADRWARPPEPAVAAPGPRVDTPESAGDTPGSAVDTAGSAVDTAESAVDTAEPSADTAAPAAEVTAPAAPADSTQPPAVPEPAPPAAEVQARRLEQHFVYNALNTIGSLIRSDPARARELLHDFAALTRATDRTGPTTLGEELAAVQEYLRLEQARFGRRLQVVLDVAPETHPVPVASMQVLGVVRETVQQGIEPRAQGGLLTLTVRSVHGGCEVRVTGGVGPVTTLVLPS